MSDNSLISWTDATWNVATGCTRVSAGCDHCYIERTMPFRVAHRRFDGDGPGSTTGVTLHPDRLDMPLHWRRPRLVFVNSLADLFHEAISDDYIARTFAVMALSPRHTFQVLTKRPGRMRALLSSEGFAYRVAYAAGREFALIRNRAGKLAPRPGLDSSQLADPVLPLANVWVGVSVESQQWVHRIDVLRETPAAVRWISAEPLLGPLDLSSYGVCNTPWNYTEFGVECQCRDGAIVGPNERCTRSIDWVVAGGESGPGARPMHPEWARSLRDQCQAAGVPFHFKQWGEWAPGLHDSGSRRGEVGRGFYSDNVGAPVDGRFVGEYASMTRVGKKRAGRELDGRTWDEYPRESVPA